MRRGQWRFAGGFDALLLVENDMILPPDALLKMAAVDADVVYGLYVNRHGWRKWLAYTYPRFTWRRFVVR